MKKGIKNIIYMLAAVMLVTSCEWDPIMFDDSKSHVAFNEPTKLMPEQGGEQAIVVRVSALDGSPSLTVEFEFDTTGIDPASAAFEGTDFTLVNESNTLSFPNGWGYDTIWIDPVDNDIFTGDRKFNIVLTSNTEDYPFGEASTVLVTLADNEHPLGNWIGSYAIDAVSYGNPGGWDEAWTAVTAPNPDDVNQLMITITTGYSTGSPFPATIDLENMTIEIAAGTDAGDAYGVGATILYVGDYATIDQESPIVGTISEDGSIAIDELAVVLSEYDGGTYWDAFNTSWTKTAKKAAIPSKLSKEKAERLR